jgi:hypothetical protein
MMILACNVPDVDAIAYLKTLPDNETMIKRSLRLGTADPGSMLNCYQYLWIALAHEKVGMYDGALRIISLALETDNSRGASPQGWHKPATYACKGRVLAALGQPTDAMAAFEAGVEMCETVPTFKLVEAAALRDLAGYCTRVGNTSAAERVQAQLDTKLAAFACNLTAEQFAQVSFGL